MALLVLLGSGASASAQNRQVPPPNPRPTPDFLFGAPKGSASLRGSLLAPRGGSDWFDFVSDQLTLDTNDFNAPAVAFDVGIVIGPRVEAVAGFEFSQKQVPSEYRDWVDNNRLAIEQTTTLKQMNISGSVKVPLLPRGRQISQLAWLPRRFVPYAGAGGGVMRYEMEQIGDFVDFVDLSVFPDVFRSKGWTPSGHVFAGVDVRVFRRLYATVDGRYLWAAGDLGSDWIDFDPIDLSGRRISFGVNVIF